MIMKHTIFYIFLLLVGFSCGTTTKTSTTNSNSSTSQMKQSVVGCNEIVEIMNYTHEADCQYLFKMEDGTLLFPAELPVANDIAFYKGAGLKIGYEILKEDEKNIAQVACKQHDYLIKVTCVEQFVLSEKGMPASHQECVSIKNPYKFNWMRNAITNLKPNLVTEYPYNPGFIYEFKTNGKSTLYDCLGNQMCDTKSNADCQLILDSLKDPKVILVVNN